MNASHPSKPLFAAIAVALLVGSINSFAADGVVDSFDRMLAHQPSQDAPASTINRDADPLIRAIVMPLRDGVQRPVVQADPVADGFARMLAHTPSPLAPSFPSGLDADPLIGAVVEPLRRWLAESAMTTQLASARINQAER